MGDWRLKGFDPSDMSAALSGTKRDHERRHYLHVAAK